MAEVLMVGEMGGRGRAEGASSFVYSLARAGDVVG